MDYKPITLLEDFFKENFPEVGARVVEHILVSVRIERYIRDAKEELKTMASTLEKLGNPETPAI